MSSFYPWRVYQHAHAARRRFAATRSSSYGQANERSSEALNGDFRYQLTVIGTFAQAIVKDEIKINQFTIQTDKPNVKVSWQVTGIRRDAYATAYPTQVEQDKSPGERGRYLTPEVFMSRDVFQLNWDVW